uniref:Uncharacterized protein n=1 Tax=Caenorhabditis japonica TaxID=281687 RepID=A0A8R1IGH6_CAEJA
MFCFFFTSGNRPRTPPLDSTQAKEDEWKKLKGDTEAVQKKNNTNFVKKYLGTKFVHPELGIPPSKMSRKEEKMKRTTRVELARLTMRSQRSLLLEEYKAQVENRMLKSCSKCSENE